MRKRVKLNSYEPFVRDKNMKFVTHSWYNKILSFGTPFELLKTYKIFQCKRFSSSTMPLISQKSMSRLALQSMLGTGIVRAIAPVLLGRSAMRNVINVRVTLIHQQYINLINIFVAAPTSVIDVRLTLVSHFCS